MIALFDQTHRRMHVIDAAIVGLGRWGRRIVESVQGQSEAIRFVAAVTRTPANAAEFADGAGLAVGDDFDAILKRADVDAVVLATPNSQHAGQIAAAAAAGKHVLVEKPFTLDRASAVTAAEAAARAGIVLAPAHNRRFLPAVAELRARLAQGQLGTLCHVEANYSSGSGYRYHDGMWRALRAESPAGSMTATGIHILDALIGLFGRITRVQAQSLRRVLTIDVDDTTSALLQFENGMSGYLATLGATADDWRLQAFGAHGWAEIRPDNRLCVRIGDAEPELIVFETIDTVRAELEAFAAAITGEAPYPVPVEDAVHGVAVMEAMDVAAAEGGAFEVS
ncbi:MAG TPA: Gfo/Idh/MocA family oxidoreductase [Rhodospirillales bacterium]|nr:Gfo/Idh/MocA family oxidoreductase [Rhodospirillales bacterium]